MVIMNEICPWCGEPQHFSVQFVDTVVPCRHCGREFLLSKKPRDGAEPRAFRAFLERLLGIPSSTGRI